MSLILDGTNGLSDVDGSAATPAIRGTDANTGIFFPAADTIAFSEGGVEAARFDSAGNLGLGITNPTKKLSITGSSNDPNSGAIQTTNANAGTANQVGLWASNGTQSAQFSLAGTGYTAYGAYASGNAIIYNDQAITLMADNATTGIIKFAAGGNTERARIDSSGRLLLGTTGNIDNETGLGVVNSTSAQNVVIFRNGRNTSGDSCLKLFVGSNCQNTSSYLLTGAVFGTANVIYIYGNGNVQNTNNSYGGISDVKLKENIVDATPKLDDLLKVKVRSYNFINDESKTKQLGVVAQELETIFPSMIEETPDKDAEGNELETTTKGVKYSVFVPMLIKAIQEQQVIIESLKARLDAANL